VLVAARVRPVLPTISRVLTRGICWPGVTTDSKPTPAGSPLHHPHRTTPHRNRRMDQPPRPAPAHPTTRPPRQQHLATTPRHTTHPGQPERATTDQPPATASTPPIPPKPNATSNEPDAGNTKSTASTTKPNNDTHEKETDQQPCNPHPTPDHRRSRTVILERYMFGPHVLMPSGTDSKGPCGALSCPAVPALRCRREAAENCGSGALRGGRGRSGGTVW
jgi:hypothetical protein